MEFIEVLRKRRSIRKYLPKEVKKESIDQIIEAGTLAPSAHFKEPWEVLVIRKEKKEIAQFLEEYGKSKIEDIIFIKTAHTIENCDTLLLIYCNDFEQEKFNWLSIGAMIENMLLKATELGIGSLWIGNICSVEEQVNTYFQIDSKEKKLISAVALGYIAQEPRELIRKKAKEITKYLDS